MHRRRRSTACRFSTPLNIEKISCFGIDVIKHLERFIAVDGETPTSTSSRTWAIFPGDEARAGDALGVTVVERISSTRRSSSTFSFTWFPWANVEDAEDRWLCDQGGSTPDAFQGSSVEGGSLGPGEVVGQVVGVERDGDRRLSAWPMHGDRGRPGSSTCWSVCRRGANGRDRASCGAPEALVYHVGHADSCRRRRRSIRTASTSA